MKGSITPVRCLRRFFSAVRCPPGRRVGDVDLLRPPTVNSFRVPRNSCSFVGQITAPVRLYDNDNSNRGAFTFLEVKRPFANQTTSPFNICISMKGELAHVSLAYLHQKQFVFVSGHLYSYKKVNSSDHHDLKYKVAVRELNFIRTNSQKEVPCKIKEDLKKEEMAFSASTSSRGSFDVSKEERIRERQILWQIFFANPFEWWDQRATKRTSKHPDFRHKNTGEALWIRSDDPPWVKKQLHLYDSKMSEIKLFRKREDHGFGGWKMQDFDHL